MLWEQKRDEREVRRDEREARQDERALKKQYEFIRLMGQMFLLFMNFMGPSFTLAHPPPDPHSLLQYPHSHPVPPMPPMPS